jgi:hypothetical protein
MMLDTTVASDTIVAMVTPLVALLTSPPGCGVKNDFGTSVYSTKFTFPI